MSGVQAGYDRIKKTDSILCVRKYVCVKVDNKENDMCEQHNTEVSIR